MGASVWQREDASGGGKTFTSGLVASPPRNAQRSGKRKLVWKRDTPQDDGENHRSGIAAADEAENPRKRLRDYPAPQLHPTGHISNGSAAARGQHSQAAGSSAHPLDHGVGINRPGGQDCSAASIRAAERPQDSKQAAVEELRRLKEKIARQEAKMQREQAAAKAQAEAARRKEEEMSRRRSRLQASMSEAFKEARDAMADAAAKRPPSATAGDNQEVARVLRARDDYEVLQLPPGCTLAALKRRYREMAVSLHPDKCLAADATDAFQRLMTAYQNILKFLA